MSRPSVTALVRLAGVAVIVIAFSLGPLPVPDFSGVWGSIPHVVAYAALTVAALSATPRGGRVGAQTPWIASVCLLVLVLGAAMEVVQRMVGRDAEVSDVVSDVVGVILGVLLAVVVERRRGSV